MQEIASQNPGLDLSYTARLQAPTGVRTSWGNFQVHIRWDEICNGPEVTSYYQVSRATSTQAAKVPICDWQTATFFEDRTAEHGTGYYYWIQMALDSLGRKVGHYSARRWGSRGGPLGAFTSTAGGSITAPTNDARFLRGETITIAAEPADANLFVFVGWTGTAVDEGNVADPGSPFTSLIVAESATLKANFLAQMATLIVDDNGPDDPGPESKAISDPNENGTRDHPFDSIQEAIEVASPDATIQVRSGTYYESINFMGKNIHVTGIDPNDTEINPYPVIDAKSGNTVVTFDKGEDTRCQLSGFTLTGGYGSQAGAIACLGSSPTVVNCLIVGNRCEGPLGGAVYCVDSHSHFGRCTITGNYGGEQGAGLHLIDSAVSFEYSLIVANAPFNVLYTGTNASMDEFRLIEDREDHCPMFQVPGYWATSSDGTVVSDPTQPRATWIHGDYHLTPEVVRWDEQALSWVLEDVTGPCVSPADPDRGVIQMGAYGQLGAVLASGSAATGTDISP